MHTIVDEFAPKIAAVSKRANFPTPEIANLFEMIFWMSSLYISSVSPRSELSRLDPPLAESIKQLVMVTDQLGRKEAEDISKVIKGGQLMPDYIRYLKTTYETSQHSISHQREASMQWHLLKASCPLKALEATIEHHDVSLRWREERQKTLREFFS